MSKPSYLIAVDIGNSTVKLGWFDARTPKLPNYPMPLRVEHFPTGQTPLAEWFEGLSEKDLLIWYVASVHRSGEAALYSWVRSKRPFDDFHVLTYEKLPLRIELEYPGRVGMDRLAAAVAANERRSGRKPAIVVDTGTAITVDLVNHHGAFLGGAILPGFRLTAEALAANTDQLPLTLYGGEDEPAALGKNTEAALKSGQFWGTIGAVRELIERMSEDLAEPPEVFVTGGDLKRLAPFMAKNAQFVPHMVLSGIMAAQRR
ncbi:MAG TPA: type III pantothenate kinase [Pirellulaceae bacterium]|nr:type III pantothenate kinase [Pirellulaceae bacterium]